MYQNIGINLSKNLNAETKRIKIPAITQKKYYKSYSTNDNINYLDDKEIYDENDCLNENCMMEKLKNLNSKFIVGAGIGILIGCIGLRFLLKKK